MAKLSPFLANSRRANNPGLQYLHGVGPVRAERLKILGLTTPQDLLRHFPSDWQDRREMMPIRRLAPGQHASIEGEILSFSEKRTSKNLGLLSARVKDASGESDLLWFKRINPRYDVFGSLRKSLVPGMIIRAYGDVQMDFGGPRLHVQEHEVVASTDAPSWSFKRIVPVHPLTEGLSGTLMRSLIAQTLPQAGQVPDPLPDPLRVAKELLTLPDALRAVHFPENFQQQLAARRRIVFDEFFNMEVVLALARRRRKSLPKKHSFILKKTLLTPFRKALPFEFTDAQKKVIREIFEDLLSPLPMNRLLQGDVGSGKTVVAASCMLLAAENGMQSCLMAPTEILAEQHGITLRKLFEGLAVEVGVLSRRATPKERKAVEERVARGEIHIVVGTHAVLEEKVRFKKLGLIVIDEQHRFGVEHRQILRDKGDTVDVLVMTATPIPRTLALSLYGDLDTSTIASRPAGRQPIDTRMITEVESYAFAKDQVKKGFQVYVVFPLIEESEKLQLKAAVQEYERLARTVFQSLSVAMLHGQMKSSEKQRIMEEFRTGKIQILVATPVIEVGIDVPNANLMIIQHPERFGLAGLHQLRGRVGRGKTGSYCHLIVSSAQDTQRERLKILTETNDGFIVSERDLALRGPGEIMGLMQHGVPAFKLADLRTDARALAEAREAAFQLVDHDPLLCAPEHEKLKRELMKTYAERWQLLQVG